MSPTKPGPRGRLDAHLEQTSVTIPTLAVLLGLTDRTTGRLREQDRELGATVVEWVVITAVLVTIALGVALILTGKFGDKANDLDLTTP